MTEPLGEKKERELRQDTPMPDTTKQTVVVLEHFGKR